MMMRRLEVALVGTDTKLPEFLAEVFELTPEAPYHMDDGILYRLGGPAGTLKVMVPTDPPAAPEHSGMWTTKGIRYYAVFVDDFDATLERAKALGAKVGDPVEPSPGVRISFVRDPEGNFIEVVTSPNYSDPPDA